MGYNKELEIFIDVDGVIFNINKKVIDIANKEFNTNYNYISNKSWWWEDYTTETGYGSREYFEQVLNRDGLFNGNYIIDFARERINDLYNEGYKIYFLSSPHYTSKSFMTDRINFLSNTFEWFNPSKHLILTARKDLLDGKNRVLIDDYIHNLDGFRKGIPICFSQRYNEDYKGLRVKSWNEAYCLINLMERGE